MADANRGWIGALPPWIQRHEASPSPPFQQPASIRSLAQAALPMSVHPIPTEYASPAPIGAPQDDSEGAEDVAADLELLASQSGNLRRIKLIMPQYSQPAQDNFATPAARLKNRPKRAVTQASNPVPPALTDDDDLADEDYVVPRSVSTSLGMKKQREKMRVNPLAPASASPRPTHNHHFPSNAYLSLASSAWPSRVNLAQLNEDGTPLSPTPSGDPHVDGQDGQVLQTKTSGSPSLPSDSSLNMDSVADETSNALEKIYGPQVGRSDASEAPKQIIITVPEYNQFLDHCEDNQFIEELNYPESLPIAGLSGWSSTLERKMRKEGLDPYCSPSPNWDEDKWDKGTYINCDLRYYDLSPLGKFDVVLVDPPWRIRGAQNVSDEKTIFNNNRFTLQYNTMSNEEIMDLDVGQLSDRGFIFLWTINSQLQTAFECLNRWGYNFVDRITWIKKTNKDSIFIGQGYYFLHSSEICLIGAKKDVEGNYLELVQKVSNDLIFASTQKKSQKPDQLYQIIERMFPGARKVELFARNHNIRPGWLSLGNQLGSHYNWSHDDITCDECHLTIQLGHARYKHRWRANRDLCQQCLNKLKESPDDYFALQNRFDEQFFHEYFECNGCNCRPLWGIRFTCQQCPDFDLCETCHDSRVVPEELRAIHLATHNFNAIEVPEVAGGLTVHRHRCLGCNTFPIVGCRFKCVVCYGNMSLCQKCFFAKKTPRSHLSTHEIQIITEPMLAHSQVQCDICRTKPIIGPRFKCQQCFNFDICQACHDAQRPPPPNYASHKPTHTYHRILGDVDVSSWKEHKGGDKGWGPSDGLDDSY